MSSRPNPRLYIGRLSRHTRTRDIDHMFSKYGRIRDLFVKHDYGFVEYHDVRDAEDAVYYLNNKELDGSRIVVEFAREGRREPNTKCFNCGKVGHWARDCTEGDWSNKCYNCGERGHIQRECRNQPTKAAHGSRSRSRSPRRRSRSPSQRSRSRSRSRSRHRSRSRSHSRSKSPAKSPVKSDVGSPRKEEENVPVPMEEAKPEEPKPEEGKEEEAA